MVTCLLLGIFLATHCCCDKLGSTSGIHHPRHLDNHVLALRLGPAHPAGAAPHIAAPHNLHIAVGFQVRPSRCFQLDPPHQALCACLIKWILSKNQENQLVLRSSRARQHMLLLSLAHQHFSFTVTLQHTILHVQRVRTWQVGNVQICGAHPRLFLSADAAVDRRTSRCFPSDPCPYQAAEGVLLCNPRDEVEGVE